jgi:hypothetical protein
MANPLASRAFWVVLSIWLGGMMAEHAAAQQAQCTCCGHIFSPRGATWMGMDRRPIHGRCPDCILVCWDCEETAKAMKELYNSLNAQRNQEGLRNTEQLYLDQKIKDVRQRWADLRFHCLDAEGKDNGRLDPSKPDEQPGKGLLNESTKDNLRRRADQLDKSMNRVFSTNTVMNFDLGEFGRSDDSAAFAARIVQTWSEYGRMYRLYTRLANDPPDKEYRIVPEVKLGEPPALDDKPRDLQLVTRAAVAMKNSNDCFEAYITSLERYQAAEQAKDKGAMGKQVKGMMKLAAAAEAEALKASVMKHELRAMRLKALGADGGKWREAFGARQQEVKDGWPAKVAEAIKAAGVTAEQSEAFREKFVALKVEEVEKVLAESGERVQVDEKVSKALAGKSVAWPEPPHAYALGLMRRHAQQLHDTARGKKFSEPGADAFKESAAK